MKIAVASENEMVTEHFGYCTIMWNLTIVKHLQEKGYTAQNLARLRAPIGLTINAKTQSEIAISILAEIISVRRGK